MHDTPTPPAAASDQHACAQPDGSAGAAIRLIHDLIDAHQARGGRSRAVAPVPITRLVVNASPILRPLDEERSEVVPMLAECPDGTAALRLVPQAAGHAPVALLWYRSADQPHPLEWTGRLAVDGDGAVLVVGEADDAVMLTAAMAGYVEDAFNTAAERRMALSRAAAAWDRLAASNPPEVR
jgi:hypothetical protein